VETEDSTFSYDATERPTDEEIIARWGNYLTAEQSK